MNWPSTDGLGSILGRWRGARAREIPLTDANGTSLGNNGDALMYQVYRKLAADSGISIVDDDRYVPDLLVIPPNGALLDRYQAPALLAKRLALLPDVPLVIFPSSALFLSSDPGGMFAARRSPVDWILRERYSYEHLASRWGQSLHDHSVRLHLDHDVVATGHEYAAALVASRRTARVEQLLLAARLDIEAKSLVHAAPALTGVSNFKRAAYKPLPSWGKRWARRRVTKGRQGVANRALLQAVSSATGESFEAVVQNPDSIDVSDSSMLTYNAYLSAIADSSMVVTNRLHVALPSAAAGNRTFLVESGYHKLRGVYEQSLAAVPNISLVSVG